MTIIGIFNIGVSVYFHNNSTFAVPTLCLDVYGKVMNARRMISNNRSQTWVCVSHLMQTKMITTPQPKLVSINHALH